MTTKKTAASYSPEVRERAVRLVLECAGERPTQWAAISPVAAKIGCTTETLRNRVRQAKRDGGAAARADERRARTDQVAREGGARASPGQ